MERCYKCGASRMEPNKAGFQDVCEGCGSYLHCCCNCRFYDEYAHNNCAETQAEYVSDANGMNRCEYFIFKAAEGGALFDDADDTKPARRRAPDWRGVRKDAGPPKRGRRSGSGPGPGSGKSQQARQKLEDLFRKEE